jgi:hypothetical protein
VIRLAAMAAAAGAAGCAVTTQMLAAPDDLADYRAFRAAAYEGTRLARAQDYVERHPRGAWADEVRAAFDVEEAAWFESAKVSRSRAREYVVELPRGPHVEAARSLLLLFDEHQGDIETLELLASARRTAAMLDAETERRRRVGDLVLQEIAALLDPQTWGARLEDPPPALAGVLRGAASRSWGGVTAAQRADRLYFVVPTPQGAQARDAEVRFQLVLSKGRVTEGWVEGEDLFVRWAEAITVRVLDPTAPRDRASAAATVVDVLAGAAEAQLPAASCERRPRAQDGEILARDCDGWSVSARMGAGAGEDDVVLVRGPERPGRAPAPGMR